MGPSDRLLPDGARDDAAQRWQPPSDAFLRTLLALPELALVAESCDAERRLHDRLAAEPTCDVTAAELAALVDDDARDNYATFLAFRTAVVAAGSLEAYYLALVRGGPISVPPVFLDRIVGTIVERVLVDSGDAFEHRAAQLLHRAQRIAFVDGRVLSADSAHAERAGGAPQALDLARTLAHGQAMRTDVPVLARTNAHEFFSARDPHAFVLDLTHEVANDLGHGLAFTMARADSGLAALARVLERWIAHFFAIRTTIRPLQRIDDPAWRWHIGLDAEASALLNALYRGETPDDEQVRRLIGLFRLDVVDAAAVRSDVAGKPIYLGLAITREQTLKLKPQNLLVNLPLAAVA